MTTKNIAHRNLMGKRYFTVKPDNENHYLWSINHSVKKYFKMSKSCSLLQGTKYWLVYADLSFFLLLNVFLRYNKLSIKCSIGNNQERF